MRICAVIVAGGQSSRMGREKAMETIRGRRMIDRMAATLGSQVDSIVVNATGDTQRFLSLGLPIIADLRSDIDTPLAGVHAALDHAHANGFDAVLTAPSDAPFLPGDLVQRLADAGRSAAIAASGGQPHYLTGLWSRAAAGDGARPCPATNATAAGLVPHVRSRHRRVAHRTL